MANLRDYRLEEGKQYQESVRAGHLDDMRTLPYLTPVFSTMEEGDPLKGFIRKRVRNLARDLTARMGKNVLVRVIVEGE